MKEEGLVDPDCVFQIGIRGHGYAQTDTDLGYNVIEYKEFQKLGAAGVVREIRARDRQMTSLFTLPSTWMRWTRPWRRAWQTWKPEKV